MKILIVNKFLYPNGGSETYIFELGKKLREMGHETEYFGMEHEGRIVGNRAEVYTAPMDFHGSAAERFLYPFKIIYSREAYGKMIKVLEAFDPDAVHLNNFNFQLTPSILYGIKKYEKKRGKKIPVIMTAHDSQLICPDHLMTIPSTGEACFACENGRFMNCVKNKCIHNSSVKSVLAAMEGYLYRALKTYRYIDLLICPSDFLREKMMTDPVLAPKLVTIHNFVSTGSGDLKPEEALQRREYMLYFGRYSREKGIETLLQICRELPDIPFVFAGDGPFKEQVAELENVKELGFLSGQELRSVIAGARVVLFPSQCNENCPFSVMEAQMLGAPVLGSRLGGIPELIEEGKTGYLLEPGNVTMWVERIRKLWEDKGLSDALAQNCRNVKFYTVEEYCDILLSKIRELSEE